MVVQHHRRFLKSVLLFMSVKTYSSTSMFFSLKDFVSLHGLFSNSWVIWNIGVSCACNWNKRLAGLMISVAYSGLRHKDLSPVGCFVMCFWETHFLRASPQTEGWTNVLKYITLLKGML